MNDIAIRGGTLIDGTGASAIQADLGIKDGRISEIGGRVTGRREIDAAGKLVVPGFVDIHTHYDPQVLWDASLTPSCWHGVTSVVAGNCGFSVAPVRPATQDLLLQTLSKVEDMNIATLQDGVSWGFETYGDYLNWIGRRGTLLNFGGFVGHTAVRTYVMGDAAAEREATADEIRRMKTVVAESIQGGALGFSTDRAGYIVGAGGKPVPSVVAAQDEVEALMRVTSELGRGIVHVAPGETYQWLYEFQPSLKRPIQWTSILTWPPEFKNRTPHGQKLRHHLAGRKAGLDIWVQVTCRPITQELRVADPISLYTNPAFNEMSRLDEAGRLHRYADHGWRARAWDCLQTGQGPSMRWSGVRVTHSPKHPELVGRTLAEIAVTRDGTPLDAWCDIAVDDDLATRMSVCFANDDEAGIAELLTGDGCILGLSDAGAHANQICDAVLPTDFLAKWVRDRGVMPLAQGIHKLTGEPARILEIERGVLQAGRPADVLVLDYEALDPGPVRRVADLPAGAERLIADQSRGIDAMIVNGVPCRLEGRPLPMDAGTLPGQILRPQA